MKLFDHHFCGDICLIFVYYLHVSRPGYRTAHIRCHPCAPSKTTCNFFVGIKLLVVHSEIGHNLLGVCLTRFLCQNRVLIVCMTQDQLFHTNGQKCSQITKCHNIEYNYYINNVFEEKDDSPRNGTAKDSITPQERQPG
jgi:hypothetical protein